MRNQTYSVAVVLSVLLGLSGTAHAGPYADRLARCVVNATTDQDKIVMLQWVYAVFGLNKNLKTMNNVTDSQRLELVKQVQSFTGRTFKVTCKTELADAKLFEGGQAINYAAEVFGRSVMSQLIVDPSVVGALKELTPPDAFDDPAPKPAAKAVTP